ncbi:transposase, partial [Gemmata sp. JC717]|uniref:transposase n=1 Tax=Gemmata algarum TaxID=2975278 RepID=UPI0021BB1541
MGRIAAHTTGPTTLVLDNARYQRCAAVEAEAKRLGIVLLFLPSYSPNLNVIERLWRFTKKKALRGKYDPDFATFRAAIDECLDRIPTDHREALAS